MNKTLGNISVVKDTNGNIYQTNDKIKNRQKGYFEKLLKVENRRGKIHDVEKVEGLVNSIPRWDLGKAIRRNYMKCM